MNNNNVNFSTPSQINEYIKSNQSQKLVYDSLTDTWKKTIDESNDILEKISTDEDYLKNNLKKVENYIETLNLTLDYYNELGINYDAIAFIRRGLQNMRRDLEKNYRYLSFKYYQYMLNSNKIEILKSNSQNKELKNKIEESENKLNSMDNRIESLGGTFLNIVLTISIVSSMIAVLLNVKPEYAVMIVFSCAWLLLSSILFISEYYKSDKNKKSFGKIVYIVFSIITFFIVVFVPIINKNKKVEEKTYFTERDSISQYISIEDKDVISKFLNNFSSYWKNNDDTYINNLDIINIDYISKINFYKRTKGNLDYYDYEILLVDNKTVVLKINSSDLKEWLYQNNLLIK